MTQSKQRGFTMVELLVVVVILGLLLTYASVAFTEGIRRSKVRTAAEAVQTGLRLARATATSKNYDGGVFFSLTNTLENGCALSPNGLNWVVSLSDPVGKCDALPNINADPGVAAQAPHVLDRFSGSRQFQELKVVSDFSQLRFDSLGRTFKGAARVTGQIDISPAQGSCDEAGCSMRIQISNSGQISTCDPKLPDGKLGACK